MTSKTKGEQIASSQLTLPPDTYIYSIARLPTTYAAISSDDSLVLFDQQRLEVVHKIPSAHKGITSLFAPTSVADNGQSRFVTGGRDGKARLWDGRDGRVVASFDEPRGAGVTAVALNGNLVAAGTESTKEGLGDVSVLLWDIRNPSKVTRQYTDSHTDTITTLSFHPSRPTTLLSASTDGLLSLFDTTLSDEDDALLQVFNHKAAVNHAGFVNESQVYAISSDEQLSVYDLGKEGDAEDDIAGVVEIGDVRGTLRCAYVVNVIPSSEGKIWVASGDTAQESLTLTSLDSKSWKFESGSSISLPGAHGEEVVRDVVLDDQHHRIVTCGEDGHVRVWRIPGEDAKSSDSMIYEGSNEATTRTKPASKKGHDRGEKARYKPY